MKAKLYKIEKNVVTQFLSGERAGDRIIIYGEDFRVVNVLSSNQANYSGLSPEKVVAGEVRDIEVPDSIVRMVETYCTYSGNFTVGLWLGFLVGRGYIDSIP